MVRTLFLALLALLLPLQAAAQVVGDDYAQGPGGYYRKPDRSGPYSIDANGTAVLMGLPMPFVRSADPFILPATTTPQQYVVTQPSGAKTYLGQNPCPGADVRVKSVKATVLPMVTVPATYNGVTLPGVSKLMSGTDSVVSSVTGTRFIGRFVMTLGSSANPMQSQQRVISIMIVPVPGSAADISGLTCPFELQYGNGS